MQHRTIDASNAALRLVVGVAGAQHSVPARNGTPAALTGVGMPRIEAASRR